MLAQPFVGHEGRIGFAEVVLDDLDDLFRVVGDMEQVHIIGRNIAFGQHRILYPPDQAAPELGIDEDQRYLRHAPGLDQCQELADFIQGAKAAGHEDEGGTIFDEAGLAREEITERHREIDVGIGLLLEREHDIEADRASAGIMSAAVARFHNARAAAGNDCKAALCQKSSYLLGLFVGRMFGRSPGRAEDADRFAQRGQGLKGIDKVCHDPENSPGVFLNIVSIALAHSICYGLSYLLFPFLISRASSPAS